MRYPLRITRLAGVLCSIAIWVWVLAASSGAQAPRDEFALTSQTVSCLDKVKSAQEALARHSGEGDDLVSSIVDQMIGVRLAQARLNECRAGLASFVESSGQRAESAALFDRVIERLIAALSQSLDVQRKLLDADPSATTPGQMALDVSELAATMDQAWRMLPLGIAAVTHALVEPKQRAEKAGLLKLRPSQRDKLVKSLRSRFPNTSKPGDQHAVDVSAGLLIKFLTQNWRLLSE